MEKVVLGFSGGLDTTFCVKYLTEDKGLEVHSVIVNTGGFTEEELKKVEAHAYALGVKTHTTVNAVKGYYDSIIKYLIYGNVLKNNTYPLSVSAERLSQALHIAEHVKKVGAKLVAHGSTGAGNDQVRFDVVFRILAPECEVITPIRDLQLSREAEIDFLKSKGVVQEWHKSTYSINKGLWGTSVGGKETLTSDGYLPEEAWPTQLTETKPSKISLQFEYGQLVGIDGKKYASSVDAIRELTARAGAYAIGRDIHVGDTIIGIKGRVGFEAPAPLIIIKAHHLLEKHVLTKHQLYWKQNIGDMYGTLLHEGQFLDPIMRNFETFLADTQDNVTGTVNVVLSPYQFQVTGIESKFDLMSSAFGAYGEMNKAWTGDDVRGFSKIVSNQTMIHRKVNEAN
ncbi:MAG: Argininosuccinate synthase [Bacteroidota bacterium]